MNRETWVQRGLTITPEMDKVFELIEEFVQNTWDMDGMSPEWIAESLKFNQALQTQDLMNTHHQMFETELSFALGEI